MRHKPEIVLIAAMSGFALLGSVAMAIQQAARPDRPAGPDRPVVLTERVVDDAGDAAAWFGAVRPYCNPVEVESRLRALPAPPTPEGDMRKAACYALAGRIDRASRTIDALPEGLRYQAAGVVFDAGHPAADAGDDAAAGPLMELVLKYWPTNYMALYHAGKARFEKGDYGLAKGYLERFLAEYPNNDGWRSSASSMLQQIGERP